MKKYVTDKDNICLSCKKVIILGKHRPGSCPEMLTWCQCQDVSLAGPNKGARRQCRAFEPKEDGVHD
jgi:hypothetical protein